jgi:hypothetical protein
MGTRRSNSELVEKLSSFCGFDKVGDDNIDRKYLLLCIITEPELMEIEDLLDKHRVPPLLSDEDLAVEDAKRKKEQAQPRRSGMVEATTGAKTNTTQTADPLKFDIRTSYETITALAGKIIPESIRVFTVNDNIPGSLNGNTTLFTHGPSGFGTSGLYRVHPDGRTGAANIPGMENVHVLALRKRLMDEEAEKVAALGEIFVSCSLFRPCWIILIWTYYRSRAF